MRIIGLNETSRKNILTDLLKRDPNQYSSYAETVQGILDDVKERGDEAVFSYTKQFDGAQITAETVRVTREEQEAAFAQIDPKLLDVMKKSMKNILAYHEKQRLIRRRS